MLRKDAYKSEHPKHVLTFPLKTADESSAHLTPQNVTSSIPLSIVPFHSQTISQLNNNTQHASSRPNGVHRDRQIHRLLNPLPTALQSPHNRRRSPRAQSRRARHLRLQQNRRPLLQHHVRPPLHRCPLRQEQRRTIKPSRVGTKGIWR